MLFINILIHNQINAIRAGIATIWNPTGNASPGGYSEPHVQELPFLGLGFFSKGDNMGVKPIRPSSDLIVCPEHGDGDSICWIRIIQTDSSGEDQIIHFPAFQGELIAKAILKISYGLTEGRG